MDADAAARPRFKSCVEPIIDSDDGLFLLMEGRHAWMPDPIYAALAPWLDGAHEIETIFEALANDYPVEAIFAALDDLRTAGYLADDAADGERPAMAFWEHAGVAPSLARSRLDAALVSIAAVGDVDVRSVAELLERDGVRIAPEGDLTLVVTDDYLRRELAAWNTRSLASGNAWLLAKPVGLETWIGPLFQPGRTACWDCLAQRLRGHRRLEELLARRTGAVGPVGASPASLASIRYAALAEAATEVARWIGTGGQSNLLDAVISTSALTLARTRHVVTRRPQCPSCGTPASGDGRVEPVRLRPRRKVQASDGGHRASDPREVLAQLERHLSPITGIVSALSPGERTGASGDRGGSLTPTFAADHNFSDMHDDRFFLREGMRRRSGGKGKSLPQARASALAESLERYCGVFDGTEPRIRASLVSLGAAAIHPNVCMGYSDAQYAERESNNRKGHKAVLGARAVSRGRRHRVEPFVVVVG